MSPVGRIASITSNKREHDDVDQPGIEKLRGEAFDQADDEPGEDGPFHVAEAADDDDREGLHDHRGAGKRREHQHRREHGAAHAGQRRGDDEWSA